MIASNRRRAAGLLLTLALASCTRVGTRPTPPPAPVGEAGVEDAAPARQRYAGVATLTGRRVALSLELQRVGSSDEVSALLLIPDLTLEAQGSGRWDGESLALALSYDGGCAGTVTVRARVESAGRLSGTLEARDCTGGAEGPLAVELRGVARREAAR